MRKSRQEAAQTRQRIVEAASWEFRCKGIGDTGLADIMAAAGLTHGGFYKHFDSKDQVVEESLTLAIDGVVGTVEATLSAHSGKKAMNTVVADYLSVEHRDDPSGGCPFVGLGIELSRSSDSVRDVATAGFKKLIDTLASSYAEMTSAAAKKEAMVTLSTIIGAATLARIVNDEALSTTLLQQARLSLTQ
ncbi:TetR/AcrR family transcriptional regulator [Pseudomonas sp. NPDC088368]|jgi:TetR/AcrR family transcriptional repressor of nem operon|uniref:TetR/AcrR family transcriptional regulator n=1 Tax=unclassified Pseudomonas TaxID=196821 RepID=UPI001412629A|nr:TetR/AcrR family transcriptional regulator [Pseudomonas sp. SLFW]NBB10208.1 TetR family transcriptional regulator [Pseudomonas sp. SLFW]